MTQPIRVDRERALHHLMDLLKVPGLSGQEGQVAEVVKAKLRAAGVKDALMVHDQAHKHLPVPGEVGNLIVKLPGTFRAPRRMFSGHLDTVPLCRGAEPVLKGNRIVPKGRTALGADDRTAVACLVTLAETVLERGLPYAPTTLVFTIAEEIGLWGARNLDLRKASNPRMGFNIDGGKPAELVTGAIGADRWEVDVFGKSAHAGMHPEEGISAAVIAARALAEVAEQGWFGRVEKGRRTGTSNVGTIRGGEATNQVTDHMFVKGESRSHSAAFHARITKAYRIAFERAAKRTRNTAGECGRVAFRSETDYGPFHLRDSDPVVAFALAQARGLGLDASTRVVNGGLDANYFNRGGVPTVTLGAGQHGAHTLDEYADVEEYLAGCDLAVALATARPGA